MMTDRRTLQQRIETEPILSDLDENIARIKEIAGGSSDLLINPVTVSGVRIAVLATEGMLSTTTVTELILEPLNTLELGEISSAALFSYFENEILLSLDRPKADTYGTLFRTINSGFAVIIAEGMPRALAFGVQGYDRRGVDEPSGEANVMGARDGFTEVVRVNMSLLRRRLKSPVFVQKLQILGEKGRTDICLCYMSDRVPQKLLDDIQTALDGIELESVLSSGYIRPFLEQRAPRLFHGVGTTERPDVLCAKLIEGRVGLLIDGTPFALVLPRLFCENFQTLDDYNAKPYFATFLRWLKYAAFLLAILLPGVYTAICLHHPELMNSELLRLLAEEEANAPFSLIAEAAGILLLYEIIREAGLRLPKVVGGAVSIVAGLIIGDAAVSSGLISTPLLTVSAIAVVAGFVIPDLSQGITILRLGFLLCGGIWGLFGVSIFGMLAMLNICATEDYGFPVTAPLSPFYPKAMRDVLTRVGFRKLSQGNFTVEELHD